MQPTSSHYRQTMPQCLHFHSVSDSRHRRQRRLHIHGNPPFLVIPQIPIELRRSYRTEKQAKIRLKTHCGRLSELVLELTNHNELPANRNLWDQLGNNQSDFASRSELLLQLYRQFRPRFDLCLAMDLFDMNHQSEEVQMRPYYLLKMPLRQTLRSRLNRHDQFPNKPSSYHHQVLLE